MLGPPKTAFVSASGVRNGHRTFDSTSRPSFSSQSDSVKFDRQSFKERFNRQAVGGDCDANDAQDPRPETHRRGAHDRESWSARHSRLYGHDDDERPSSAYGDQDQEKDKDTGSGRENRTTKALDNHRRVPTHDEGDTRRNGLGRGRREPPWHRDERDSNAAESRRDTTKPREWREKEKGGPRGVDRDWHKGSKLEQDPEWLDEPDLRGKKQAHTQEDFERWKERMKASSGFTQDDNTSSTEQQPNHERTSSGLGLSAAKTKVETPLVVDPSIDGFFGYWNDATLKSMTGEEYDSGSRAEAGKAKTLKSSKFTGFFESKNLSEEPWSETLNPAPVTGPIDSSSEDKEGFQRILKLLDQQQNQPTKNENLRGQHSQNAASSILTQSQQQWDSPGLNSFFKARPTKDELPQNKDSEFLLKLMQQPRGTHVSTASADPRPGGTLPPDLLPFSNLIISPQQSPGTAHPPGIPSNTLREDWQQRDKLGLMSTPERKGPPPGLFESQRSGPPDAQRPGRDGSDLTSSFINQPVHQQRSGMMPPPGFPAPLRNPSQFAPGFLSNIPNTGQDRNISQAMRVGGGIVPPSMPPPGFINTPPPGFPSTAFNSDGPGRIYYGGGSHRPQMDGFGEVGNYNLGPAGLPGPLRRQE